MQPYTFDIEADIGKIIEYAHDLNDNDDTKFRYLGHYLDSDSKDVMINIGIPIGKTILKYNHHTFTLETSVHYCQYSTKKRVDLVLTIDCESKNEAIELLKSFITSAIDFCKNKPDNKLMRMIYASGSGWVGLAKIEKRPIETIYLDDKIKQGVIGDIKSFLNNREKYIKYGIPYSKSYMFAGPQNTGKTSFIMGLASMFNKNLAMINFNQKVGSSTLAQAFTLCDSSNIIVLENIDVIISNNGITFNELLNIIDGLCRREGMIIFMTTTDFDKLENKEKIQDRIDKIIHFSYPDKQQIKNMFDKFLPNQMDHFPKFYSHINKKNTPISILQKFLFNNIECENILDKLPEITSQNIKHSTIYL